jgi:fumarate reductase flavoprotein subunit
MYRTLTGAALLAAALFAAGTASATPLADRHKAKGLDCLSCHVTKPEPFAEVPRANCLKCHPETLIVSKYADLKDRNPHKNHLGEVDCNICHRGHDESLVYCDQCHKNFKLNIK